MTVRQNRFIIAVEGFSTRLLGPRAPVEEKLKSLSVTTGPRLGGKSESQKPKGIAGYYGWYESDGAVFAAVNSLAEFSTGGGYVNAMPGTTPSETPVEKPKELQLVDELGEFLNLDSVLPNITRNMLIAGFCGVEVSMKQFPSKCKIKVIHPATITKIELGGEKYHGIDYILQKVGDKEVKIDGKNLAWYVNYEMGNDKRGVSIIMAIEKLLSTKMNTLDKIDKLLDRRLAPLIIWKTMRDETALKEAISQRDADEDIFLGHLTQEEMASLAQVVDTEGDVKYWEYIEYIDRLIYKSLFAGDLDYWRQATQASATVLLELVDRNIMGIQRQIKRSTEQGIYQPLMELNNLDVVPRIIWNQEDAKFRGVQLERFLQTGVNAGFIQMPQFYEILKRGGLDIHEPEEVVVPAKGGVPIDQPEEPSEEPKETPEETLKLSEALAEEARVKALREQFYRERLELIKKLGEAVK